MAYPLRVPDRHFQLIGRFRRAQETADSTEQIAKDLGVSKRVADKIDREFKNVLMESKEAVQHGVPLAGKSGEVWRLLRPELSPAEQKMYDAMNKTPNAPTSRLAKILSVSPGRVSQYKASIRRKLEEFSK